MPETTDFSPVATARRLAREVRAAALSTLQRRDGMPFGSLVSVSTDVDGTPILLLSGLAAHSRNLAADSRASLLFVDRIAADPQTAPRITLVGRIEPIADPTRARRRHLARHPDAALYAGFADFAFHRLAVEDGHLVAGFGRAMRVAAEAFLLDREAAERFAEAEAEILAEAAGDPAWIAALAARAGGAGAGWSPIGADPEGLDLGRVGETGPVLLRIALPEPVDRPDRLLAALDDWRRPGQRQEKP
jgi:putative heme iron utilization protein